MSGEKVIDIPCLEMLYSLSVCRVARPAEDSRCLKKRKGNVAKAPQDTPAEE